MPSVASITKPKKMPKLVWPVWTGSISEPRTTKLPSSSFHIRKPDVKEPPPKLSALSQPVLSWLQQASGSRALINQTEARFGIEEYTQGEASLLLRGHVKLT